MNKIISKFNEINVSKNSENYSPHKPILILITLLRCFYDKDRMIKFSAYEELLSSVSSVFNVKILLHYPFFRLVADGIWEVEIN